MDLINHNAHLLVPTEIVGILTTPLARLMLAGNFGI